MLKTQHCCVADCLHVVHVLCWGPWRAGCSGCSTGQPTLMVFMTVLSCAFALAAARGGSSSDSISMSKSSEPPGASSSKGLPCSAIDTRVCCCQDMQDRAGKPCQASRASSETSDGLE